MSGKKKGEGERGEVNETKYQTLFESSRDAKMMLGPPTWQFISPNTSTLKLFGVKSEKEFTSKTPRDFSPEYQPDGQLSSTKAKKMIGIAMKTGSHLFEWNHQTVQGKVFPANVLLTRIEIGGKKLLQATVRNISERKKIEAELIEAKERAEQYLDIAGTILISLDKNGNITLLNKKGYEVLGWKEGELIGKNWFDTCIPKEIAPEIKRVFKKNMTKKTGFVENYTNEVITKNKTRKIIHWHNTTLKSKQGKNIGLLSSGEDITERKIAEEKIAESKTILKRVINLLPLRIFWKDKQLRFLGCNDLVAQDAGKKSADELIGKSDFDMSWKKQAKAYRADDLKTIETGRVLTNYEEPQTTPDGQTIWLRTSKVPLTNNKGETIGVLGCYEDITEQKKAKEILKESEEKFRNVLDASPFPMAVADYNDAKILYWSASAKKLFGHTPDTTSAWYKLAYPNPKYRREVIRRWKPLVNQAQKTGEVINTGKYKVACKDGSVLICELYAKFIDNNLIVTFNDITEEEKTKQNLEESEKLLSDAQKTARIGSWNFNVKTQMPIWSAQMYALFGLDPKKGELSLQEHKKFMHPDDWDFFINNVKEASRTGKGYDIELRLVQPSGKIVWVNAKCTTESEKGKVVRLVGTTQDITEKKLAEANITDSQAMLKHIINLLPLRIFWKDKQLRYLGCNDLFAHDAGKSSADELIGKDDFSMGWKEQAKIYRADDMKTIKEGRVLTNYEEPQTTPDGKAIWLRTSKIPLTNKKGETIGVLGCYQDITKEKEAQEEAQRRVVELENFNNMVIHRELKMVELKKKIKELEKKTRKKE